MMDDSFGRMWIIKTRRGVKSVANRQTFSGDRSVGAISIPLQFGAVIDSAIDYK